MSKTTQRVLIFVGVLILLTLIAILVAITQIPQPILDPAGTMTAQTATEAYRLYQPTLDAANAQAIGTFQADTMIRLTQTVSSPATP